MFKKYKKIDWIKIFFYPIVLIYSGFIVMNASFGVIDDHGLLDTLLVGKEMPFFIIPEIGRFFPLDGYEYSLISNMSLLPISFYLYNAVQFFVIIYLMYKILVEIVDGKRQNIIFFAILFLIFMPGFTSSWLRLFIPERSELLFFIAFLFFFLKYQKEQKIVYLLVGLLSANIALYYKEPAFLMLGSFAFFHLVFGWKELNIKQKIFDFLLIISAFIFIVIYFFVVHVHKGDTLYGASTINPLLVFVKNIFNYTLSDPLVVFIMLPLVLWRIYAIIKSKKVNCLYDAMLFSSAIYVLVFLKLNMFAHHYLLPAYAFGLVAIVYFIFQEQLYKTIVFKFLGVLTGLFLIFSSLPTGLHLMSHYKNVPNNFQDTLSFLTRYIETKAVDGQRVSIFIDGVNRNGGEVHHSFIKYLEFRGLKSNQFDIKSDEDDNGILPIMEPKENASYTILSQITASNMVSGDLIIVTPYTAKYVGLDKKEISEMNDRLELLYHADSFLEIPNIGVKSVIKQFYRARQDSVKNNKVMASENIFQMPLDFYVFRKK